MKRVMSALAGVLAVFNLGSASSVIPDSYVDKISHIHSDSDLVLEHAIEFSDNSVKDLQLAYHYSHRSHSSHQSHRSHYSHYSSYGH